MDKKSLLSAACFSLGAAAIAFAQTASVPSTVTPPGSTDTAEPGANAASPEPAAPDQGATGAASSGGTNNEPTGIQPTDHGSVDSAPTNGKATANGEGTAAKGPAAPDQGSATSRKAASHSRPHAVPASAAAPQAGSIDRPDRRSPIAPQLPAPPSGENASADQFLRDAQTALRNHHTGEAQEALERAETRVLEGAKMQGTSSDPSQSRVVAAIEQAREALGHRRYLRPDVTQAGQRIDQALAQSTGG